MTDERTEGGFLSCMASSVLRVTLAYSETRCSSRGGVGNVRTGIVLNIARATKSCSNVEEVIGAADYETASTSSHCGCSCTTH